MESKVKDLYANTASDLSQLERIDAASAYRNQGIISVTPLVSKPPHTVAMFPAEVHYSRLAISWPMNAPRMELSVRNKEVGEAYNELFGMALTMDACKFARFVLTQEQDNIPPPNAVTDLVAAIYKCPDCGAPIGLDASGKETDELVDAWTCKDGHRGYDAVGGLYFVKSDPPMPMAYGDPKSEELEFRPREIAEHVKEGRVIEVNGIAMGCTLFRKGLFEKLSKPWFQTTASQTQDLYFCEKAKKELGARFAVHCGVQVGHLDTVTGRIF